MAPLRFLSNAEFQRLSFQEQLAYLSKAMAEVRRGHRGRQVRWDDLFKQQQPPKAEPPKT